MERVSVQAVATANVEQPPMLWEQRRWYLCFGWHKPTVHSTWITQEGSHVHKGQHPSTRAFRSVLSKSATRRRRRKQAREAQQQQQQQQQQAQQLQATLRAAAQPAAEDAAPRVQQLPEQEQERQPTAMPNAARQLNAQHEHEEGIPEGAPTAQAVPKDWEWRIVISETTDENGWQYARCNWYRLLAKRLGGRNYERCLDFVKRRQWVHKSQAQQLLSGAKAGTVRVLTPDELAQHQDEAQRKWDRGVAEVWLLLAQLNSAVNFKSMAAALLDPIALQRVAKAHSKAMCAQQLQVLSSARVLQLPDSEMWPPGPPQPLHQRPRWLRRGPAPDQVHQWGSLLLGSAQSSAGAYGAAAGAGRVDPDGSSRSTSSSGSTSGSADPSAPVGLGGRLRQHIAAGIATGVKAAVGLADRMVDGARGLAADRQTVPDRSPGVPAGMTGAHDTRANASKGPTRSTIRWLGRSRSGQLECPGHLEAEKHTGTPADGPRNKNALVQSLVEASHKLTQVMQRIAQRQDSFDSARMSDDDESDDSQPGPAHAQRARRRLFGRRPQEPPHMQLSVAELECALGHALGIYGDLDTYLGGYPVQTYCEAVHKYSGVPEQDVLMAVWRSQAFEPAHYVALDRQRKKVVVCIRGTMELVDTLTDLVGRPTLHSFSPGLRGVVHAGILRAAQFVVASAWTALQEALAQAPSFTVLVTGHSLGGGTAALVALLLRNDPRLPLTVRHRLRAVAIAPAAVAGKELSLACRDCVATVVCGSDIVPRVDVYSVAQFVQAVASASKLTQAVFAMYKALSSAFSYLSSSGRAQAVEAAATETVQAASGASGGVPEQRTASVALSGEAAAAEPSGAANDRDTASAARLAAATAAAGPGRGEASAALAADQRTTSADVAGMLQQEAALQQALQDLQGALQQQQQQQQQQKQGAAVQPSELSAQLGPSFLPTAQASGKETEGGPSTPTPAMDELHRHGQQQQDQQKQQKQQASAAAAAQVLHAQEAASRAAGALASLSMLRRAVSMPHGRGRGLHGHASLAHEPIGAAAAIAGVRCSGSTSLQWQQSAAARSGSDTAEAAAAAQDEVPGPTVQQHPAAEINHDTSLRSATDQSSAQTHHLQASVPDMAGDISTAPAEDHGSALVAAAAHDEQGDDGASSQAGGTARLQLHAMQSVRAAMQSLEATVVHSTGSLSRSAISESITADGVAGSRGKPQGPNSDPTSCTAESGDPFPGRPSALEPSSAVIETTAAAAGSQAMAPTSVTPGSTAAAPATAAPAAPATSGPCTDGLQPDVDILEPLFPPGTVYWVLEDSRSRGQDNEQQLRAAACSPHPQGDVDLPAWQHHDPRDMSSPAAGEDLRFNGQEGAPAGASVSFTLGMPPAQLAKQHSPDMPHHPSDIPQHAPDMRQQQQQQLVQKVAGSAPGMGGFLGGLNEQLEAAEEAGSQGGAGHQASGIKPSTSGAALAAAGKGSRLCITQVDAHQFSDMLFFKKAISDHMPLAYLGMVLGLIKQQREAAAEAQHSESRRAAQGSRRFMLRLASSSSKRIGRQ